MHISIILHFVIICYHKKIIEEGFIIENCRNCKREVENKIRRCPYCGIMNPTVTLKDIFTGIAFVLVSTGIFTYFQ